MRFSLSFPIIFFSQGACLLLYPITCFQMLIYCMCIILTVWDMVIGQKTKEVATINGMPLPDARLRFVFFSPSCHVKIDMKHACNDACY